MRRRPERLITSLAVASLTSFALLAPAIVFAQSAPDVEATPPAEIVISPDAPLPETSPVGQPLTLTFTIAHPRDAVLLPPEETGSSRFVISDATLSQKNPSENGPQSSSLAMTLLPLRAGTASLAGLMLGVSSPDGESLTMPLHSESIKFVSTLDGEAVALRPPQPPHVITQEDYTPVKVGAGVLAALLVLGLVALGVHALKPEPEPPAPKPIDVVASEALRALESAPLDTEPALVAYYTQMSEILRDYFGKRYGFPGTEYTTSEILGALPVQMLPPALGVSEIAGWLRRSDRVKFSSLRPEHDEARADLRQALGMVELTRPVAEEPEPVTSSSNLTEEAAEARDATSAQEPVVEAAATPEDLDDAITSEPEEVEQDESVAEEPEDALAGSALGALSWDELSEMVDELDEEEEQ